MLRSNIFGGVLYLIFVSRISYEYEIDQGKDVQLTGALSKGSIRVERGDFYCLKLLEYGP